MIGVVLPQRWQRRGRLPMKRRRPRPAWPGALAAVLRHRFPVRRRRPWARPRSEGASKKAAVQRDGRNFVRLSTWRISSPDRDSNEDGLPPAIPATSPPAVGIARRVSVAIARRVSVAIARRVSVAITWIATAVSIAVVRIAAAVAISIT